MSRALLRQAIQPLPRGLRDDVSGYATFVNDVAGQLAAEMKIELSRPQTDQVLFLAAIVYLRDVVAGQLALVEAATGNRGATADTGVTGLRLTGEDLRPNGPYERQLRSLVQSIEAALEASSVPRTVHFVSDVIKLVAADA